MTESSQHVRCESSDGVTLITLDDGKRNALSPEVFAEIYHALDQAEKAHHAVVITGREGIFSAGFDLKVMKRGGMPTIRMLRAGYLLTARLMSYPRPVVAACNGHCFAMGVFMMLSADYIIGSQGPFEISANEVELGLTMPRVAATSLRQRLRPAAYQRAVNLSERFDPEEALKVGFFDELVTVEQLASRAMDRAHELKSLDARAHAATKRRIRANAIRSVKRDVYLDLIDAGLFALRGSKPKTRI